MKDLVIMILVLFVLSYGVVVLATGFKYRVKEERLQQVGIAGIITIVTLIVLFAMAFTEIGIWNDGVCLNCGGNYEYIEAVGHGRSTGYIYQCDTCGDVIELGCYQLPNE